MTCKPVTSNNINCKCYHPPMQHKYWISCVELIIHRSKGWRFQEEHSTASQGTHLVSQVNLWMREMDNVKENTLLLECKYIFSIFWKISVIHSRIYLDHVSDFKWLQIHFHFIQHYQIKNPPKSTVQHYFALIDDKLL